VTQLNGLLSPIEAASKNTQADLSKLRIERWKADGSYKKQALGNVDSIQRNLQEALPEIVSQLRNAPEDLAPTFKLYRNLDALYDVLRNVTEDAAAYGSKDDLQSLSNDLSVFEGTRKQLAERIENLSSSKEAELTRLRTQLKTLQTQVEAAPPKKIVVDDTEPPKKPAPKKKATTTKKPTDATKPAAGSNQTPPVQQGQTKPQ
jgi:predicted  nucleic acid-binding Zn-ribbon protein